jgi:allene oxide cyclase
MRAKPLRLGALGVKSRVSLAVAVFAFAAWLVIGGPRIANAASDRPASAAVLTPILHPASTVHVIEHAVTDTVIYSGGAGKHDVTGNLLTWHNKVYAPTSGKQVGRDQGSCVRIAPADGTWECSWTTFLPSGQITVAGPFNDSHDTILAITGGTGAFRDARGQMNLHSRDGGKQYDFIFHLS